MRAMAMKTYEDGEYGRVETSMDKTTAVTTGNMTADANTQEQPPNMPLEGV